MKGKTYLYRFGLETFLNVCKMYFRVSEAGACHGDDLGYLFNASFPGVELPKPTLESKEHKLIKTIVSMVTTFIINGKPDVAEWKPLTTAAPLKCWNILNDSTEIISLPEQDRLKVWDEILEDVKRCRKSKRPNKL